MPTKHDTGESRFFYARPKCTGCGRPIVPEIDQYGICPECVRLRGTVKDYGPNTPRNDVSPLRESRFWHTEDGFVVDGCYRRICN